MQLGQGVFCTKWQHKPLQTVYFACTLKGLRAPLESYFSRALVCPVCREHVIPPLKITWRYKKTSRPRVLLSRFTHLSILAGGRDVEDFFFIYRLYAAPESSFITSHIEGGTLKSSLVACTDLNNWARRTIFCSFRFSSVVSLSYAPPNIL